MQIDSKVQERFWSNVSGKSGDDECWMWTGYKSEKGYGVLKIKEKAIRAHRLSYILAFGEIPTGMQLDHLCRNKVCVNPRHLEAVTSRENTIRAVPYRKPRAEWAPTNRELTGKCKNGHDFSGDNIYISPRGLPFCRLCKKAYKVAYRESGKHREYMREYMRKQREKKQSPLLAKVTSAPWWWLTGIFQTKTREALDLP